MNLKIFNECARRIQLGQNLNEWKIFLEICEMYLKKHEIKKPVVVELGIGMNGQKNFYEQLLGAEHIGIDIARKHHPDIHGDTHDPRTLEALKKKLNGRSINILFIDACHSYEGVKRDLEIYFPLCSDIIALHDIECNRHLDTESRKTWKFWDELKKEIYENRGTYKNVLTLSIYSFMGGKHPHPPTNQMGIGMIIIK